MQFNSRGVNKGKVVYWVNGQHFENSKDKRDGREKAEKYCLDNFINPNDIQKFDSRTEVARYEYLLTQAREGKIKNLAHHFTIKVQDEFTNCNGDVIPPITFEADFIYQEADGTRVVEDVKGSEYFLDERFITLKQVFDNKMCSKGLYIRVILFRNKEWVEWRIGEKKKSQKLIKKQREEIHVLKQAQHTRMVEDNKRQREHARYMQLCDMLNAGVKLTSAQRKRFNELFKKFAL